jgi:transcriptional regulator with XRE-family HTH domain
VCRVFVAKSVFTERYERFRVLLIDARKNAELTQVQLAAKLGCPQSYVSKYERGERRLDVVEFLDVAHAIGIDATEFLRVLDAGRSSKKQAGSS